MRYIKANFASTGQGNWEKAHQKVSVSFPSVSSCAQNAPQTTNTDIGGEPCLRHTVFHTCLLVSFPSCVIPTVTSLLSVALHPVWHILKRKQTHGHHSTGGRTRHLPSPSHKAEEGVRLCLPGEKSAPPPSSKVSWHLP